MFSFRNGKSDGAEEQAVSSVAGCGLEICAWGSVGVFADQWVTKIGKVAADLVGASCRGPHLQQGGLPVDRERAMVQYTPVCFGGFAVEGGAGMAVLQLPGGEGQVPFFHGSIGEGLAQGGGSPEGEGEADPSGSGFVKPMHGSREGHAIWVNRAQCGLILGGAMVGLVGDDACEVAVARSAGGDACGFPDQSVVRAIRAVNPQVPRRLATWIWRVNRFQTEVDAVSFPNEKRRSRHLAIASDVAAVQGLSAVLSARKPVREKPDEGLLKALSAPVGAQGGGCGDEFFDGCGFQVHGWSSVRWTALYFCPMNMGSVKTDLYQGHDYYMMDDLLTEEHKLIRDAARAWVKQEVSPIIEDAAETQVFPKHLLPGLGAIGAFGPYIPEQYGGAGLDQISYGIIMQELERCDSGLRSTASVQSSLVMYPIWKYGSEEQKMKYLPKLATGEMMGCFGLTEPDHGSNPGGMITNFKDAGDGENVILNGAKLWISNAPFADIAVVWAKNEEGRIHGIVVERGMEGFSTPKMTGKWSLRASDTGELIFEDVKVPKSHILPGRSGLGGPLSCLDSARYGIAWGAIGAALDCYDTALRYAKQREQFGRPIAGFQLQQKKLAEMITEITKAQLLTLRLGQLRNEGKATSAQISMAKRNNVDIALQIAREARQVLGGMGITGEYPIMRHMMNLESVVTYEGTHDIHLLITGLDITGENAFK